MITVHKKLYIKLEIEQYINSVFASNTWVLREDENAYLIDCGDIDVILATYSNRVTIKGIFLTHTHFDHIYGINKVLEKYPFCVIYTSNYGIKGLTSSRLNLSFYYSEIDNIEIFSRNVQVLKEQDRIQLFDGVEVIVFETPGHDPSCLTYCIGKTIFTGDAYIPGNKVVTNLPHGDKRSAEISVMRINRMIKEGEYDVCPGHEGIVYFSSMADDVL